MFVVSRTSPGGGLQLEAEHMYRMPRWGLAALAAVASMAAPAGDGDGQTSVIFSFLSDTRVR